MNVAFVWITFMPVTIHAVSIKTTISTMTLPFVSSIHENSAITVPPSQNDNGQSYIPNRLTLITISADAKDGAL